MLATLVLLATIGGAMSLMGWLRCSHSPGRVSLHFELERMRADVLDGWRAAGNWVRSDNAKSSAGTR